MGKRTLWTGIALGAVAGGLTALLDKDARKYVKDTAVQAKSTTEFYINNPSLTVSKVKGTVKTLNENLAKGAESAMNALDKYEKSLNEEAHNDEYIDIVE